VEEVFGPTVGGWLDSVADAIMALPSPLDVGLIFVFVGAFVVGMALIVGAVWMVTVLPWWLGIKQLPSHLRGDRTEPPSEETVRQYLAGFGIRDEEAVRQHLARLGIRDTGDTRKRFRIVR